jgi:hypothetical protein
MIILSFRKQHKISIIAHSITETLDLENIISKSFLSAGVLTKRNYSMFGL